MGIRKTLSAHHWNLWHFHNKQARNFFSTDENKALSCSWATHTCTCSLTCLQQSQKMCEPRLANFYTTRTKEAFSERARSSLRQKAQTSSSISCSSWAAVSERRAFFTPLSFSFLESKHRCSSSF